MEKGRFVFCCLDLHRSNAEMMKQKKKHSLSSGEIDGPTRGRDRTSIAELLADERCSQAVLQFFAATDVGWTSGPPVAEGGEDAASEASEWEARNQAERAWERREEESLGAE